MARKELIANDPMETKLMTIAETVHKIGTIIAVGLLAFGVVFGIVASDFISDLLRGSGGFISFLISVIPNVLLALVVWLIKTLICLWLEFQTEMHCYARVQTEILMDMQSEDVTTVSAAGFNSVRSGEWKCHSCGRVNKIHKSVCTCGQRRDEN